MQGRFSSCLVQGCLVLLLSISSSSVAHVSSVSVARTWSVSLFSYSCVERKGLAKLGNIVAETLLRTQMFPSLAARETYVAETNFAARKQKMSLPEVKNIFVSRTQILRPQHNVSQFSHSGKHKKQQCFRNNVS